MLTELKPSQVAALLAKTIPAKLPVLLVGPPGVGKTDLVTQAVLRVALGQPNAEIDVPDQAAVALSKHLLVSHPVVSDSTDPKGLPAVVNGEATWLPYGDLRQAIKAKELLVWFLDDLGQAPPAVQAAFMQLLLSRKCNGHAISEHVVFVAATNRREDRAGVTSILEPVKSRFATIVNVVPDVDDWVAWALDHSIPIELIAFARFRPTFISDWKPTPDIKNGSCPRTLANVARLLDIDLPEDVLAAAITRPKVGDPQPMIGPPAPFSIEVAGQRVEGQVGYVCRNQITVEITQPFHGLRSGCHIPALGMQFTDSHFSRKDGDPSTISENGWKTARGILVELYKAGRCLAEHGDDLRAALLRIEAEQNVIAERNKPADALDPDAFREERRKLRAALRQGEIDQSQYGRLMGEVHKHKRAYDDWVFAHQCAVRWSFSEFARERYGVSLNIDTEEQIIEQIRRGPAE